MGVPALFIGLNDAKIRINKYILFIVALYVNMNNELDTLAFANMTRNCYLSPENFRFPCPLLVILITSDVCVGKFISCDFIGAACIIRAYLCIKYYLIVKSVTRSYVLVIAGKRQ